MTPPDASRVLMDRIQSRSAIVGVIGLGYVGLPLALAAVEAGFQVLGFDINPSRVAAIGAGRQVINYLDPSLMRTALDAGRFSATTDFSRLSEADAVIICVPTPVTRNRDPDLSYVRASAASAAARRPAAGPAGRPGVDDLAGNHGRGGPSPSGGRRPAGRA